MEGVEGGHGLQHRESGDVGEHITHLHAFREERADCLKGYGTAIGVITALFEADLLDRAYYAQTTPYHQGTPLKEDSMKDALADLM